MHERERHRIILSATQEKAVVTVQDIAELTDASEATIRRDIASLHVQGKLRRVRGGAEAVHPPQLGNLAARPFRVSESVNIDKKRAIARKAVDLCNDGDAIILNGGTTTFQMVHYMAARRLQVMTNSFAIAEHLVKHSKCNVSVPGGAIYRDQSLILSPFENDAIRNFYARRIFLGAQGVGALGIMESDALVIQSEQKLMRQAEELIVMVDSSKFRKRSSLILCPLENVSTIITDDGISDEAARMVEDAGVELLIAGAVAAGKTAGPPDEENSSSVA
ncbi:MULTISPECIES: DeoR/GlpR family DNA-binding transcription regulator [Rhizobium/Agrobacterium group]|uniref:DeoR/GlpR transcriptional regulator n=2 Tax=Agrobacterium tumefaciens complex TaxID=1183400 RepID=A0AAE6BQB3_AGRTU|nr:MULTISPECIES: DeoR/GlpR family DNA-binding transcription regulator [Rhizobium/Agrobacterium group]KNY33785.1 DeoR faimly transcriptional regulator [Agrobacterium sp. SUL3]KRA69052.1 DeoR family transcriptional regulator [Rhizobium sp. Root651]MCA2372270.1 DeoR/GlpR transcriptional regulator [Agrobacterium tomkonis CIP 111-78]MCD4663080.1 DeoR/GlpR family DNA-binding transcription regulator [Agrobacterium sp.]MCZ7452001.1 DeoR/GlpR family DNA-binding transcription regulator [Rhizobium rhizog